jgi:imidazolonepropionase-like amidohydrolase
VRGFRATLGPVNAPEQPDRILLRGARLCDGSALPAHGSLLLEGGAVAAVLDPGAPPVEGARVIDLPGALVVPGLADVHTHLVLGGDTEAYERELLKDSLPLRALRAAANARLALDHGVLTMRDVCTEGAGYADVALRDAIRAGLAEGPRVVPSGPGIGITGGYLPMGVAPGVCIPTGCAMVDGPDAARREVRAQVSYGVEWIKVFADWPEVATGHRDPRVLVTFTQPELFAICDEARRRGRRVAAHVTSDAGARQAIACGAASLEHMGDLTRETLDAAAAADVTLVPTLSVLHDLRPAASPARQEGRKRFLDDAARAFERALASGVRIACGTDIGCFPHARGSLGELGLMMALGMRPLAALRAATSDAAALLGLPSIGRLSPGATADLAIFAMAEGSDDLGEALEKKPVMVIQAGRVVRGKERGEG